MNRHGKRQAMAGLAALGLGAVLGLSVSPLPAAPPRGGDPGQGGQAVGTSGVLPPPPQVRHRVRSPRPKGWLSCEEARTAMRWTDLPCALPQAQRWERRR